MWHANRLHEMEGSEKNYGSLCLERIMKCSIQLFVPRGKKSEMSSPNIEFFYSILSLFLELNKFKAEYTHNRIK